MATVVDKSGNSPTRPPLTDPHIPTPAAFGAVTFTTLTGTGNVQTTGGQFLAPDGSAAAPSYSFTSDPDLGMYRVGANALGFTATTTAFSGAVGINGATIGSDALAVTGTVNASGNVSTSANLNALNGGLFIAASGTMNFVGRTTLTAPAIASLQLGGADAAAPVAQTLKVQGVVAGTSNTAGANWTFAGSQGTGTGAGGSIIFQTAPAGSTGSAQNSLVTALTIFSTTDVAIAGALTVGSVNGVQVPATGKWHTQGRLIQTSPADGQITWSNWAATNSVTATVGASNLLTLNGGLTTGGNITLPASGSLLGAGTTFVRSGGGGNLQLGIAGVGDLFYLQTNGLVGLGGTTAPFPAIKRNGTGIDIVLANDSGFTNIKGKLTTETNYTAGAIVATGYLTLYDGAGIAYRVPCAAA